MYKFLFKILVVFFLSWTWYHFIYITPHQKIMRQEIASRETRNTFADGFENITTESQLFPDNWGRWHEIILQENKFSIRRPVKYCMIAPFDCATSASLGNHLEVSQEFRRRGKNSLKFHAEAFEQNWLADSRVAIRRQLFNFENGDDIYFSGWFYFVGDPDLKGADANNLNHNLFLSFRAANDRLRMYGEPGRGLFFSFRNYLGIKMDNWLPAVPEVHQDLLNRVHMPVNKWVQIKMHLKLSHLEDEGIIEIWQDDNKIISQHAQTLPREDIVYSILEVGVSSNLNEDHAQTMYVDNLYVSPDRFNN